MSGSGPRGPQSSQVFSPPGGTTPSLGIPSCLGDICNPAPMMDNNQMISECYMKLEYSDCWPCRGAFVGHLFLMITGPPVEDLEVVLYWWIPPDLHSADKAAVKGAACIAKHTPHSWQPCGLLLHLDTAHYSCSTNTT